MKRFIALFLALMLCLCACSASPAETTAPETTEATETTAALGRVESEEEAKVLKVLTIGNSHSVDANNLLARVFKKEAPDQEIVLGVLYYGGCRMVYHADFVLNEQAVYRYHKNVDGKWKVFESATAKYALENEEWDVVVMQEMNHIAGQTATFENNNIAKVKNYVTDTLGYEPEFMWHLVWPNPVIPEADNFENMWIFNQSKPSDDPTPWCNHYISVYDNDSTVMYTKMLENVKTYVMGKDLGFSGVIATGAVMKHFENVQGLSEQFIYRDYTHLTDHGRLAASYLWYATLMKLDQLESVSVTSIPAADRYAVYQSNGDLEVTEEYAQQIISAVNYVLKNPLTVPEK